eukprot:3337692-Amphidinium_carterae.1
MRARCGGWRLGSVCSLLFLPNTYSVHSAALICTHWEIRQGASKPRLPGGAAPTGAGRFVPTARSVLHYEEDHAFTSRSDLPKPDVYTAIIH